MAEALSLTIYDDVAQEDQNLDVTSKKKAAPALTRSIERGIYIRQ